MSDQMLNVKQVAEYLGVSQGLVYKMIQEDGFPHLTIGRKIRIPGSWVQEWVENQRRNA